MSIPPVKRIPFGYVVAALVLCAASWTFYVARPHANALVEAS